jgi:ABC-2 type transport system ATP-binding protein
VEVVPRDPEDLGRTATVLMAFGTRASRAPRSVAVQLDGGEAGLSEVVRAFDADGIAIETLRLHAPSLDDVFLAKTGRLLEGAEIGEGAVGEGLTAEVV